MKKLTTDDDMLWVTRLDNMFRVEVPSIEFDVKHEDPAIAVEGLFAGFDREIEALDTAASNLETKIERLQGELSQIEDQRVEYEALKEYEPMSKTVAQIMNGTKAVFWVEKYGPVKQASVSKNKKGKIVPSLSWSLWRK